MGLQWHRWQWEHRVVSPAVPCTAPNEVAYALPGDPAPRCFLIDGRRADGSALPAGTDPLIQEYSRRGLQVTAGLHGVPAWARRRRGPRCTSLETPAECESTRRRDPATCCTTECIRERHTWCAPDDPRDFARFAGAMARRYGGGSGNGRVAVFEIHNEVNSNAWFDVGCGQGRACDLSEWVSVYLENYLLAYDAIRREQPDARVLVSLDHNFLASEYDEPDAENPTLSGQTLLGALEAAAGTRQWQVGFHAYPPNMRGHQFSPDDLPVRGRITFGSLGALPGWLWARQRPRGNVPPSALEIHLTENGITSAGPLSSPELQATALCNAFRNVLGTPGVAQFAYYRMLDHPADGGRYGLHDAERRPRPAWRTWALADHPRFRDVLRCGFEAELGGGQFTRLVRYYDRTAPYRGHWVSSRLPPPDQGFELQSAWRLARQGESGTRPLFECLVPYRRQPRGNRITTRADCDGGLPLGPVGFARLAPAHGAELIRTCRYTLPDGSSSYFVAADQEGLRCEGHPAVELLGYATRLQ
ncbi:MAG TPA: DUF5722 domain-containing protein [Vicinamibacteria bacterium]|nr:DUF5722 domain-containing protein [Vicinamibacteria bacterium]